jgi:hypothetical protein
MLISRLRACRGTNEQFQVKTGAPARDMFGGCSPLEHTHVAIMSAAFRLGPLTFLDQLPQATQDSFICLVRRLVLVRSPPRWLTLSARQR